MVDPDDPHLVAGVARGERGALEALYRRHAPWITQRLTFRCHDDDMVDIAVQDTFLVVWRTAGSYRGQGDVGAWLWGIAIRKLIDQMRKRRPEPRADVVVPESAWSFEEELLASGPYGPLASALSRIEPELAAVLLATAVDGLTTKEAGVMLGIPQGTVKTRLARARVQLQAILA